MSVQVQDRHAYQLHWKDQKAGRRFDCLCGCGLKTAKPVSYRRRHYPTGAQVTPVESDGSIVHTDKYRRDEHGKWYYWHEAAQRRHYNVFAMPCKGCGRTYLSRHRTRDRYCTRSCSAQNRTHVSGQQHPLWRGGKWLNPSGYVQVRVPGSRATRLEHRVVMEEILGRPLLDHENVHHINGDKADNRPENLEVWSSSQPSGQRVEDKVAWARQILALYAPVSA